MKPSDWYYIGGAVCASNISPMVAAGCVLFLSILWFVSLVGEWMQMKRETKQKVT